MFSSRLLRAYARRVEKEFLALFGTSSESNSSGYIGTNKLAIAAAAGGAGISGLLLTYYGYKTAGEKSGFLNGQIEKVNLNADKKKNSKPLKEAVEVASAAIAQVSTAVSLPAVSTKERRFLEFASLEYDGQAFMTPKDFLEAAVHERPKFERLERRLITRKEAEAMLKTRGTPTKEYFRSLGDNGLISYTEYLFLLCILAKPQASFRVAFNMLDVDGNHFIDKKEFLVMERIFANTKFSKRLLQGKQFEKSPHQHQVLGGDHEKISDKMQENQVQVPVSTGAHEHPHVSLIDKNRQDQQMHQTDTMLMRRFFGRRGRHVLTYEEFHKFMDDLQTEIMELEFNEFSHGAPVVKETDFAQLLLRHAFAHRYAWLAYMDRVNTKIKDETGITFEQYKQFCQFLTNLDDFTMAVKLYTYKDLPVTQREFARAAKISTGFTLDTHVLDTVFQIFDANDDGRLSYGEFISVMRDRLHRGARRQGPKSEWRHFKKCVREEMKRY